MPPGPGVAADQAAPAPAPPRSPLRGSGAAAMPQSPLRIRQDGKFYERLLTKESSAAAGGNLSFRYYWAEPGAVPFVWESQPGTPKDAARMAAAGGGGGALPAITPPPSYLLRHGGGGGGRQQQAARHDQKTSGGARAAATSGKKRRCRLRRIRIGFIAGFFRRLGLGKASWRRPAAPAKMSSSSSRWLFSSVATEAGGGEHNLHHHHDGEIGHATKQQHKAAPACSFPAAPWLLRFRSCSSGGRGGGTTGGWA